MSVVFKTMGKILLLVAILGVPLCQITAAAEEAKGPASPDVKKMLNECTPSANFVVSTLDRNGFEELINKQAGIRVAMENSVFSKLGSKALADFYPNARFFHQRFITSADVPEALHRYIVDAAAYQCLFFLSFPEDVKRMFAGMNAWVLPAGQK
jgi:hypothetical protein